MLGEEREREREIFFKAFFLTIFSDDAVEGLVGEDRCKMNIILYSLPS